MMVKPSENDDSEEPKAKGKREKGKGKKGGRVNIVEISIVLFLILEINPGLCALACRSHVMSCRGHVNVRSVLFSWHIHSSFGPRSISIISRSQPSSYPVFNGVLALVTTLDPILF